MSLQFLKFFLIQPRTSWPKVTFDDFGDFGALVINAVSSKIGAKSSTPLDN